MPDNEAPTTNYMFQTKRVGSLVNYRAKCLMPDCDVHTGWSVLRENASDTIAHHIAEVHKPTPEVQSDEPASPTD